MAKLVMFGHYCVPMSRNPYRNVAYESSLLCQQINIIIVVIVLVSLNWIYTNDLWLTEWLEIEFFGYLINDRSLIELIVIHRDNFNHLHEGKQMRYVELKFLVWFGFFV